MTPVTYAEVIHEILSWAPPAWIWLHGEGRLLTRSLERGNKSLAVSMCQECFALEGEDHEPDCKAGETELYDRLIYFLRYTVGMKDMPRRDAAILALYRGDPITNERRLCDECFANEDELHDQGCQLGILYGR